MASTSGTKDKVASSSDNGAEASTTMEFKRFDIVYGDVTDHLFLPYSKRRKDLNRLTCKKFSLHKNIMKQWKILEQNVPDSIYIQVYETRIDLLRAVIIGAPRTPYHDGLFFFDILLPKGFPKHPPLVHYYSHGYHLNEKFKKSDEVCLKLINTDGQSQTSKRWNPKKSTILQVLVSIKDDILNAEPFFNHSEYESVDRSSWKEQSIAYNETTFIKSCRTMLSNVQSPPKNFESFIGQHFRSKGKFILEAIQAYMNDHCLVGTYVGEGSSSLNPIKHSDEFKSDAQLIYEDLEEAFNTMEEEAIRQNVAGKRNSGVSQAIDQKPKSKDGALQKILSLFKCFGGQ